MSGRAGTGAEALRAAVAAALADDGALARTLPGFEPREGQRGMAAAVAGVLDSGGTLLAEAGTGTGKTLAYLIPAILSGQRVLVSTGTKNLQEQIIAKDLPAVARALGVRFSAMLMKGRGNYLCKKKLEEYGTFGTFGSFGSFEMLEGARTNNVDERSERLERPERSVFLPLLQSWAATTTTGDRAELRDLPEDLPLWRELSAEADTCLGSDCPHYDDCFLTSMRQRAAAADVVIVNHHLLCADAAVRQSDFGEVIPAAPTLVVDEAHQLEDVATQYFGVSFSSARVDDLVHDARRVLAGGGLGTPAAERLARALERLADAGRRFFAALAPARGAAGPGSDVRVRYTSEAMAGCIEEGLALAGAIEDVEDAGTAWARGQVPATPGDGDELTAPAGQEPDGLSMILRRAAEMRADLRLLLRADGDDFVYYLETRGRGTFLRAAPVDVSRIVGDALFDRFRSVVLTSATLTVDGSFDYLRGRLGIGEAAHLRVASEFDFTRQALLYLPRTMPEPRSPGFAAAVARETVALLTRSRGRAFVLFTSYRMLHAVRPIVEEALPYPVLVQGSAPRSALLDRFRSTPHAVLLATSSFWQGVDVAGESLSCVVIDKLPFAVPSDPITSARIDAINGRGGDAFSEYQVPLAILSLQQGLGRLLRHRADRGVLAVLDPRLGTTGYGRRFLASLPPAPVTRDLDAVDRFFK